MPARRPAATGRRPFTVEFPKPLPAEKRGEHWWMESDGHELRLSNLNKVFWPDEGYTKGDLLTYYFNIAPRMLPYLEGHPLTMKRMPNGMAGGFFYEKDAPATTPDWMPICEVESAGTGEGRWGPPKHERIHYLMAETTAAMLFVTNLGCIEFHPLHSRCGSIETPDYLFFDLDPFEPATFEDVLIVARHVKAACDRLGLTAYPKTSGATGMQVYVPLVPGSTYGQVRELVGRIGHVIRQADPDRVTMEWEVRKRTGKVFIDHNMNRVGANIAAVYSVRPEPGATVSMPLTWKQVEAGAVRPSNFTLANVLDLLPRRDPFRGLLDKPQDPADALGAVGIDLHDETPDTESVRIEPGRGRDWAPRDVREGRVRPRRSADQPVTVVGAKPKAKASAKSPPKPAGKAGTQRRETSEEVIARSKDPKLGQYLKMRDFDATPEPSGGAPSSAGNEFVIQRHDATRLHYDLRLERDGVMVSWAVPKGLPLVKGQRHLAVHTEDHPMEYNEFQGTIPKGHYGAGEVRVWDKGTYDLLEWTDKKVSFRLHGERYQGEYHLVKTRDQDWLILMASASEEQPLKRAPQFGPMLATGGYKQFDADGWWFEPKFDGVRTLLYLDGEQVRLISRTGRDQTTTYPELHRLYRRINAINAVLDGEIVATDERGRASFEMLQQRMNLASPSEIERIRRKIPVEMVVFDVLWVDGEDITSWPLSDRREKLQELVMEEAGLRMIYWVENEGLAFFEAAKKLQLEGIIAKRASSRYQPGRRTDDWRKIKILQTQDSVVLGWTPGQGGRADSFGALLVGAFVDGKLTWIGQVGTGFTDRTIHDLMPRLRSLEVPHPPVDDPALLKVKGAHWVRPELVCEVEYLQMTGAGKLRAPSFKGFRTDKLLEDCVLERPV